MSQPIEVSITTPAPIEIEPWTPPRDQVEAYSWSVSGSVLPVVGGHRYYVEGNYTLSAVRTSIGGTADAPVVVDVQKNGVSVFATPADRATIPTGQYTAYVPLSVTLVQGDYLTVSVISAGLVQTGTDLTVTIRLKRLF